MSVEVRHDAAKNRFEATVDGQLCVADYQRRGDVLWMTHTGVPPAVGGRGIAAELVRTALAWAADQGLKVEPACSYVEVYMRRHPQTLALLAR
jgi:predicted GNAT family acetyltransferase